MENSYETVNGNGPTDNGHKIVRHSPYQPCIKVPLPWLDLRVFYVRISKCEIDDSTPEYLTVNHVPLNPDTLLEVNGARTNIYSDGASTLLRRDRLDKKSEEATFVSTDSIRMTGCVKFEVLDKDVLVLSGVLELCNSNGFITESKNQSQRWSMNCESNISASTSFLKGKQFMGPDSASPRIEVYVAGCFSGTPIILTKTLQLSSRKKQLRKGMLDSIPEYEGTELQKNTPSGLALQKLFGAWTVKYNLILNNRLDNGMAVSEYSNCRPDNEDYNMMYSRADYLEGEDGELSWFNAGVRVGVGIGLSVCLGIGIGVGLLVKTYQGTTRNFKRRLL